MIFDTPRLVVRPWHLDDVEAAFRIYGDAEVLRYLGSGDLPPDPPDRERTVARIRAWRERAETDPKGLGLWACEEKGSGEVVATVGLIELADAGDIEIAYHVARVFWGRGFATEAAAGALQHGFSTLGLDRVIGLVYAANEASARVLNKIGMRYVGKRDVFGAVLDEYVCDAPRAGG